MAQYTDIELKSVKPGKTSPFVMPQGEVTNTQARLSYYKRKGSLPKKVAGYKSRYDKGQQVLLVTAVPKEAE